MESLVVFLDVSKLRQENCLLERGLTADLYADPVCLPHRGWYPRQIAVVEAERGGILPLDFLGPVVPTARQKEDKLVLDWAQGERTGKTDKLLPHLRPHLPTRYGRHSGKQKHCWERNVFHHYVSCCLFHMGIDTLPSGKQLLRVKND